MVSLKNFKTQKSLIPPDQVKPKIDSVQDREAEQVSEPPKNAIGDDAANVPGEAEKIETDEEFQKPEPKKHHNPRLPASLPRSTKPQFGEKDFQGEIRRFISQANVIFSRAPPPDRAAAKDDPTFWAEFDQHQDKIFTAKSEQNMMAVRSAIGEACQFLRDRFVR